MPQSQSPIHSITDLKPGDHACCIYDTDEEHRNIAMAAMIFGAGAALIGLLGIIGMFFGIFRFTSFFLGYKTIAFSVSVIGIIFGRVLAYHAATPLRGRMRTFVAAVVALVGIFARSDFLHYSGRAFHC